MKEDYVNFEIAKLLKEKGFDSDCNAIYDLEKPKSCADGKLYFNFDNKNPNRFHDLCAAPTLQMAMKWLREVHNIAIETEWEHLWYAYVKPMTSNPTEDDYYQCSSAKYEEAIETAIKYCLESLI